MALDCDSIARPTEGELSVGAVRVGALPGPASFDLGGTEATVADACLALVFSGAGEEVPLGTTAGYRAVTAGRDVAREGHAPVLGKPQLVLLGTTSLYGVGSSQYNRVKIPCERVGGRVGEQVV